MTEIEDQARSIFLAALERVPDQWPAFVDEACGGSFGGMTQFMLYMRQLRGRRFARILAKNQWPPAAFRPYIYVYPPVRLGPWFTAEPLCLHEELRATEVERDDWRRTRRGRDPCPVD